MSEGPGATGFSGFVELPSSDLLMQEKWGHVFF